MPKIPGRAVAILCLIIMPLAAGCCALCAPGEIPPGTCILSGVIHEGAGYPAAATTVDCAPPAGTQTNAIDNGNGSYSCVTSEGTVTLKLSSQATTRQCPCNGTSSPCSPNFP